MKTVLMVAPYFLPRRRVGALRPFKFAIHLKKFGWNPVICTIQDCSESFTKKEKKLLGDIKIYEISPPFDNTVQVSNSSKKTKEQDRISMTGQISGWLDKQIPTDSWIFLFWVKYLSILRMAKDTNPDVIWATGDPWSGLWLGKKLAADLSLPLIADFRDPWTLSNVNLRDRSHFSGFIDSKIEKNILDQAKKVVFTSKATELLYKNHFYLKKQKTETIYNAYERSFADHSSEWKYSADKSYFHIFFFGRFRRLSSVKPIADALQCLQLKHPETAAKVRVHSFGKMDDSEYRVIQEYKLESIFIQHTPVKPELTSSVLEKADLLLLSTNRFRSSIIPAKLWDYLMVQNPILSIVPNPEIESILSESGMGVQFNPEETVEICNFLYNSINNRSDKKDSKMLENSSVQNNKFSAENATQKLAQTLDELTANG